MRRCAYVKKKKRNFYYEMGGETPRGIPNIENTESALPLQLKNLVHRVSTLPYG